MRDESCTTSNAQKRRDCLAQSAQMCIFDAKGLCRSRCAQGLERLYLIRVPIMSKICSDTGAVKRCIARYFRRSDAEVMRNASPSNAKAPPTICRNSLRDAGMKSTTRMMERIIIASHRRTLDLTLAFVIGLGDAGLIPSTPSLATRVRS